MIVANKNIINLKVDAKPKQYLIKNQRKETIDICKKITLTCVRYL